MSQWTSKYAILKDLSVVQGRVPAAVDTLRAGDKPSSLNITEETEEKFFEHCSGDADVSAPPDLSLIKKMLDMVREMDISSDEDSTSKIVISKLNPYTPDFVPTDKSTPKTLSPKPKMKRRQRNVAVESILQAIAENKQNEHLDIKPELKLLKPNDFISKSTKETAESDTSKQSEVIVITKKDAKDDIPPAVVDKVNGWLDGSPPKKCSMKVSLVATNMFKRKNNVKKVDATVKGTDESPSPPSSGVYKPSTLANEYYKKYVEKNKVKEAVREDIWTRAEKQMKEIDEQRKLQLAQLVSPSISSQGSELDQSAEDKSATEKKEQIVLDCLYAVSLPKHRHLLKGHCVVCEVLTKKPTEEINNSIVKSSDEMSSDVVLCQNEEQII